MEHPAPGIRRPTRSARRFLRAVGSRSVATVVTVGVLGRSRDCAPRSPRSPPCPPRTPGAPTPTRPPLGSPRHPRADRAGRASRIRAPASFALVALIPIAPFIEFAFAVAVGVLIDALVVRSLLVPALVSLVGRRSGRRATAIPVRRTIRFGSGEDGWFTAEQKEVILAHDTHLVAVPRRARRVPHRPGDLGIVVGLVAGRTIGVLGSTWLLQQRFARPDRRRPSWWDVLGLALLAGAG
jgi:hypothetical protein